MQYAATAIVHTEAPEKKVDSGERKGTGLIAS